MFIRNKETGKIKDVLRDYGKQLIATGQWEDITGLGKTPEQKATIKAVKGEEQEATFDETDEEKIIRRKKKNVFKKAKK